MVWHPRDISYYSVNDATILFSSAGTDTTITNSMQRDEPLRIFRVLYNKPGRHEIVCRTLFFFNTGNEIVEPLCRNCVDRKRILRSRK